jgi:6-phosphogluconate dehydrogenase
MVPRRSELRLRAAAADGRARASQLGMAASSDGHAPSAGDGARELGIVGLGRMGGALALQAADRGLRVVGTSREVRDDLAGAGITVEDTLEGLVTDLAPPRAIFLYVPAGRAVDALLDELADLLEPGDVVADGGNSYWGDSIRRHRVLETRGVELVDVGTSGGVEGARHGACFMVGGRRDAVAWLEPILETLAMPGGYVHAGPPGAGHFAKLVHNGIEFAMLQAIAEGVDLLEHFREPLPVADVLRCWRHGSVIRSWLIDLMEIGYRERGGLAGVPPHVEDTGEVNWLIADALEMERPIPTITQSVLQLFASRDQDNVSARAIALMRRGFGQHPLGEDATARRGRREGRIGDIIRRT